MNISVVHGYALEGVEGKGPQVDALAKGNNCYGARSQYIQVPFDPFFTQEMC